MGKHSTIAALILLAGVAHAQFEEPPWPSPDYPYDGYAQVSGMVCAVAERLPVAGVSADLTTTKAVNESFSGVIVDYYQYHAPDDPWAYMPAMLGDGEDFQDVTGETNVSHMQYYAQYELLIDCKEMLSSIITNFADWSEIEDEGYDLSSYLDANGSIPPWTVIGLLAHIGAPTNYFDVNMPYDLGASEYGWKYIPAICSNLQATVETHVWTNSVVCSNDLYESYDEPESFSTNGVGPYTNSVENLPDPWAEVTNLTGESSWCSTWDGSITSPAPSFGSCTNEYEDTAPFYVLSQSVDVDFSEEAEYTSASGCPTDLEDTNEVWTLAASAIGDGTNQAHTIATNVISDSAGEAPTTNISKRTATFVVYPCDSTWTHLGTTTNNTDEIDVVQTNIDATTSCSLTGLAVDLDCTIDEPWPTTNTCEYYNSCSGWVTYSDCTNVEIDVSGVGVTQIVEEVCATNASCTFYTTNVIYPYSNDPWGQGWLFMRNTNDPVFAYVEYGTCVETSDAVTNAASTNLSCCATNSIYTTNTYYHTWSYAWEVYWLEDAEIQQAWYSDQWYGATLPSWMCIDDPGFYDYDVWEEVPCVGDDGRARYSASVDGSASTNISGTIVSNTAVMWWDFDYIGLE